MTTPNVDLINLDFASFKQSLKDYLRGQTQFRDYDFEGSNMSTMLDVLAYNTYLNAFFLNMVSNEVFLDTATLRDSVVSHAKELNYVPRSSRSSSALIRLTITPSVSGVGTVAIPKGTSFTTKVGAKNYIFTTDQSYVIEASDGVFVSPTIPIYEGMLINDTYVMNYNDNTQRFIITNSSVDTRSITVTVYEDSGSTVASYRQVSTLLDLDSSSEVFFLQAIENGRYEILFGNNISGHRPQDKSSVVISYRSSAGENANGAGKFSVNGAIDGHTDVELEVLATSTGGAPAETVESIKFNAPRYFQTQERAVTANDYKVLLRQNFPEIQAISVYGGEDHDPPQYGRVFISIDIAEADGVPENNKQTYLSWISKRSPLSIEPVFIDPEFIYLKVITTVHYNVNVTTLTANDIKTLTQQAIQTYSETELSDFDTTMRYSRLVNAIDNADTSILSNETTVLAVKTIVPTLNESASFDVNFFNALDKTSQYTSTHQSAEDHGIQSSTFTYKGRKCVFEDDGNGYMRIATVVAGKHYILVSKIGTVDYDKGIVKINNIVLTAYEGAGLTFMARTLSKDISAIKNNILTIRASDIGVTVVGERV